MRVASRKYMLFRFGIGVGGPRPHVFVDFVA